MSTIPKTDRRVFAVTLKIILSIWIVLHVLTVLISPNRDTYLGGRLSGWMEPYANFLELSANWNFFAPQPGPPMRLEYEALDQEGAQLAHDFWPNLSSPWRQTTLSHFVMKDSIAGERLVGSFLCSRSSGAHSVRIWRNVYKIPNREQVASGERKIGDDSQAVRQFIGTWSCGALVRNEAHQ